MVVVLCLYNTSDSTTAADTTKKLTVNNYSNSTIYLLRVFTDNGTEPYHRTTVGKVETSRSFVLPGDDKTVYQGQTCVMTPRGSSMPDTFRQIVDQNVEKQRITLVSDPERPLTSGDTVEFYLNGPYIIESGASKTVEDLPGNVYRVFGAGDQGPQDIPVGQQDQTKDFGGSEEAQQKAKSTNALNSIPGQRRKVTFVNNSGEPLRVSWSHGAKKGFPQSVLPGAENRVTSSVGVLWTIRNLKGEVLRQKTIYRDETVSVTVHQPLPKSENGYPDTNHRLVDRYDRKLPASLPYVRFYKLNSANQWVQQSDVLKLRSLLNAPDIPKYGHIGRFEDWYLLPMDQGKSYHFEAFSADFKPKIAVFSKFQPQYGGGWKNGSRDDDRRAVISAFTPQIRRNQWVVVSSVFPFPSLNRWHEDVWTAADGRILRISKNNIEITEADGQITQLTCALSAEVDVATTEERDFDTRFRPGDTIDGVTLETGHRLLVKDQLDPSENGIYIVGAVNTKTKDGVRRVTETSENRPLRVRPEFFYSGQDVLGVRIAVRQGTANRNTAWTCKANYYGAQSAIVGSHHLVFDGPSPLLQAFDASPPRDNSTTSQTIKVTFADDDKQGEPTRTENLVWETPDKFTWRENTWNAARVRNYTFTHSSYNDAYHDKATYTEASQVLLGESPQLSASGPCYIYLNFDGWTGSHPVKTRAERGEISAFRPDDWDKRIQHYLFKTAEQFSPFDVIVTRIHGNGVHSSSGTDTTVFIGDDTKNDGRNYFNMPTLRNYDFGNRKSDIGWVDPVNNNDFLSFFGEDQVVAELKMEQTIAHEVGHSLGLSHVRVARRWPTGVILDEDPPDGSEHNQPATMSYDTPFSRFGDEALPVTLYNYNSVEKKTVKYWSKKEEGDPPTYTQVPRTYSKWGESEIRFQNSYRYLLYLFGRRAQDDVCSVADLSTISWSYVDAGRLAAARKRLLDARPNSHTTRVGRVPQEWTDAVERHRAAREDSRQFRMPKEIRPGQFLSGQIERLGDYDVYFVSGDHDEDLVAFCSAQEKLDTGRLDPILLGYQESTDHSSRLNYRYLEGRGQEPAEFEFVSQELDEYDYNSGVKVKPQFPVSARFEFSPDDNGYYIVVGAKDAGSTGGYTLMVELAD